MRSSSASTRRCERLQIDSGLRQDGRSQAAFLFEQGGQEMFDIDLLVAVAHRLGLRGPDRLLQLLGETIDVHNTILRTRPAGVVRLRPEGVRDGTAASPQLLCGVELA